MRSRLHTGLLAVGGLVAGGLAVAMLPPAPAVASSQVCEGIVIDYGTLSGAPSPQVQGAQVAPGTSDLEALSTAGDTVSQNDSGLVCAINNEPTNGLENCTTTSGSDYYFWSYWQGNPYSNTWTYAEIGPGEHPVSAGQTYVQGWSFQNPGPSGPGATKPSVTPAAAFAQACPGVTPAPPSSGGGGSSGGGSTPTTSAPSPTPTTTATTVAAASGTTPTTKPEPSGQHASAATTTSSPGKGAAVTAGPAASTSTTTTLAKGLTPEAKSTTAKLAVSSSVSHGGGGGNPTLPIVIVALLIAAFAGAAWFRWRRRPGEE